MDIVRLTKDEARARCKALLANPTGTEYSLATDDGSFLMRLLLHRPDAAVKIGCGVSHFTVVFSAKESREWFGFYPPSKHMELHRIDGSCIEFSCKACIRSLPRDEADAQQQQQQPPQQQVGQLNNQHPPQPHQYSMQHQQLPPPQQLHPQQNQQLQIQQQQQQQQHGVFC
jgi:hypothetical protein